MRPHYDFPRFTFVPKLGGQALPEDTVDDVFEGDVELARASLQNSGDIVIQG